jgi:5-(carboxyamino)imidazole ribonucleotide mutase
MRICVLLGSESDKKVLDESGFAKILDKIITDEFEVSYGVYSAHRNPKELNLHVEDSFGVGTAVFVGIAGMAAALPGALAGLSGMRVPVIGVPLDEHGIDSCLYMPPGVPVLTAGVGKTGLKNAALAVCQIAAGISDKVDENLVQYLEKTAKPAGPLDLNA